MVSGVWDPRATSKKQTLLNLAIGPLTLVSLLSTLVVHVSFSCSPAQAVTSLRVVPMDVVLRATPFSASSNVSEVLRHLPRWFQCLRYRARPSFSPCESLQNLHVLEAIASDNVSV